MRLRQHIFVVVLSVILGIFITLRQTNKLPSFLQQSSPTAQNFSSPSVQPIPSPSPIPEPHPYLSPKKKVKLDERLAQASPDQRRRAFEILGRYKLTEAQEDVILLVHLYPSGFFEPLNETTRLYNHTWYDYTMVVPSDWIFFPGGRNNPGFLAPETPWVESRWEENTYYIHELRYDLFVHGYCFDDLTFDQFRRKLIGDRREIYEPVQISSPKKTKVGDLEAYHYSLSIFLPDYNVKSEDYYFEANGNYFFVNHRYIAGTEDQHLETIKAMKNSLKFGERDNCTFEQMLEGETLWNILNELDAKNPFQMVYTDY